MEGERTLAQALVALGLRVGPSGFVVVMRLAGARKPPMNAGSCSCGLLGVNMPRSIAHS